MVFSAARLDRRTLGTSGGDLPSGVSLRMSPSNLSRRFLALAGLIGILVATARTVSGVEPAAGGTYRLRFHHLHTGERLDVVYRNAVGYDPEALRKAAMETDIPVGGTMQGYGVKFYPPGHPLAGQNERAFPIVIQYVNGRGRIAWPKEIQTTDPVLPFPKGHAFAQ